MRFEIYFVPLQKIRKQMPEISNTKQRLTIRIGRGTLSFSQPTDDGTDVMFEPYVVKSGISMAANLREAFKTSELLMNPPKRVRVVLDADVLMVPVESFHEEEAAILTEAGLLILSGEELKLTRLDPDSGQVIVDGRIQSLEYDRPTGRRGLFARFRG